VNPGLPESLLAQQGRELRPMTHGMGQGLGDQLALAGAEGAPWTNFNCRRVVSVGALAK